MTLPFETPTRRGGVLEPGLPVLPANVERHPVPGGGSRTVAIDAGDEITIVDREGLQVAELVFFDQSGASDAAMIGGASDGSTAEVDAIILCTGYLHHFPFMPDELRLKTANRLAAADLYKGVAWVHNPKLFYLGMQDQWYTFNMFDAQAWWTRDAIMGRIEIPGDKAALLRDVADRVAAEDALEDDYGCIRYQGAYTGELIAETDYPSFDIDGANEAFFQWKKHKKANIMTFRDNGYKSVMTGTTAPAHHTPWVDCLDDSMADYLK